MPTTRLSSSVTSNFLPSENIPICSPEKLQCEVCGKGFHHAAVLGRHRSLHRKDKALVKPLLIAKTFPCKDCGKVFKNTRTFSCHRCSQACNNARTRHKGLKHEAGVKQEDGLAVADDFLKQQLLNEDPKVCKSIPVGSVQNSSIVSESKSLSTVTENSQSIKKTTVNKSTILIGIRSKSTRRAQNGSEISTVCTRELETLANTDVKNSRGQRKCTMISPSVKCEAGSKTAGVKNIQSDLVNNFPLGLKSETTEKRKGRKPSCPHTCKICHKNFSSLSKFQKHATLHDPSKPYGCDVCGKFFDDARFVKTHRTLHEKKSRKECNVCGKVFNERIFYDIHCLTHVEQKPFRCDVCEDIFKDKSTFLRHYGGHKARTRKVAERFLSMKEVLKQKLEDSNRQS